MPHPDRLDVGGRVEALPKLGHQPDDGTEQANLQRLQQGLVNLVANFVGVQLAKRLPSGVALFGLALAAVGTALHQVWSGRGLFFLRLNLYFFVFQLFDVAH